MVLSGMAVAPLPPWLVDEDSRPGGLSSSSGHQLAAATLYAVYTSRRYLAPKVRTFVDHLASSCAVARARRAGAVLSARANARCA